MHEAAVDRVDQEERARIVAQAVSASLLAGHTMLGENCDACFTAKLRVCTSLMPAAGDFFVPLAIGLQH